MPESTELPEYIRVLKDELEVRVEVENEVVDAIYPVITEAGDVLGPPRAEKAALPHIEAEVQLRLRRLELERKRAGLA